MLSNYVKYCFENIEWINSQKELPEAEFEKLWASYVARDFRLDEDEILALFSREDPHHSDQRIRQYFKYAASNGISGTP